MYMHSLLSSSKRCSLFDAQFNIHFYTISPKMIYIVRLQNNNEEKAGLPELPPVSASSLPDIYEGDPHLSDSSDSEKEMLESFNSSLFGMTLFCRVIKLQQWDWIIWPTLEG